MNMKHQYVQFAGYIYIQDKFIDYVDYPDRTAQWERIQDNQQNGDYQLATIQLNSLCIQQDNLRLSHYTQ